MEAIGLNRAFLNLVWIYVLVRFVRCAHLSGGTRVGRVGDPVFVIDPFVLSSARGSSSAGLSSVGMSRSSASSSGGVLGSSGMRAVSTIGVSPRRFRTSIRFPGRSNSRSSMNRQISRAPASRFSVSRPLSNSINRIVSRPFSRQSLGSGIQGLDGGSRLPSGLSFLGGGRGHSDMILMSGSMPVVRSLPAPVRPSHGQRLFLLREQPAHRSGHGLVIVGSNGMNGGIGSIPQRTSGQRLVVVGGAGHATVPAAVAKPVTPKVKVGSDLGKVLGTAGSQLTIQGQTPTGGLILKGPGGTVTIGGDILRGIQHLSGTGAVSHTEFEEVEQEEILPQSKNNSGLTLSPSTGKDVVIQGQTIVVGGAAVVAGNGVAVGGASGTGAASAASAAGTLTNTVTSPLQPVLSSSSSSAASSASSAAGTSSSSAASSAASSSSSAAGALSSAAATSAASSSASSSAATSAASSLATASSAVSPASNSGPVIVEAGLTPGDSSLVSLPSSSVANGQNIALGAGMVLRGGNSGQVVHLGRNGGKQQTVTLGAEHGRIKVDTVGAGVQIPGNATFIVAG